MRVDHYRRRSYVTAGLLVLALVGVCTRLFWIQMVAVRSFSPEQADLIAQAEKQRNHEYVVESGRGAILDRKGRPLTGEVDWHMIAFPLAKSQLQPHKEKLHRAASIVGYSYDRFIEMLTSLDAPQAIRAADGQELVLDEESADELHKLDIPGIYPIQGDDRFAPERDARQLIGRVARSPFLLRTKYEEELEKGTYFLDSRIGITGMEAAFEPFLRGREESAISYTVDGRGRPLNGLPLQSKQRSEGSREPHQLVTTIDRDVQRVAEEAMDREQVTEGAVVVQEIASGDLLAVASRPAVGRGQDEQNPWDNRAVMETPPGSVFKTVVALAALDRGVVKPTDTFVCDGELGRYGLKDSRPEGHGKQTFAQAYANSCNVVFGQVAEKLGGETIEEYAKKLGFGHKVIWSGSLSEDDSVFYQFPHEQRGMIFAEETSRKDGGAVVQTGIGQRDVRITPVQAVNMVTALFHGGKAPQPRLVQEIRSADGQVVQQFKQKHLPTSSEIRPQALQNVQEMMRLAVTHGTAQSLYNAKWPLAAKTGTAQLGLAKDRYNKWMVGYGPAPKPRYAVAVVVRSVSDSKDGRAHHIFKQVMNGLANFG